MVFSPRRARMGLIVLAVGATGIAPGQQFREIKHAGAGYIGPGPASETPETTPCTAFAYAGSAGFPYRNRSLVVDLGYPAPTVHRIVLVDDYSDNGGDSPTIRAHGIRIYGSDDNQTYTRYTGACRLRFRSAKPEGGFDAVELNGLTIRARYIKLHADLPDDQWDFANQDLRRMVRVFQDPERVLTIRGLSTDRYVARTLSLSLRLDLPKAGIRDAWIRVYAQKPGRWRGPEKTLLRTLPLQGGGSHIIEEAIPLGPTPPGPLAVRVSVVDQTGNTLAEAVARTFVCESVLRNPAGPDAIPFRPARVVLLTDLDTAIPPPAQGERKTAGGKWRTTTIRRPGGKATVPLVAAEPGAPALRIPLPVSGWYAVSVGLVGGDTRVRAAFLPDPDGEVRTCKLETWGERPPGMVLGEAFVGCRQFRDTTLELTPVADAPARVAFVRLLSLSEPETAMLRAAAESASVRRVIIHSDGFSGFYSGAYDTREKLERVIGRFADTPIYSYDWCVGPSSTFTYNTRIGTIFGSNAEEFWRQGDRRAAETVRRLIDEGNDPLRVVVERARECGVRINATLRMNANYGGKPAKVFNGEFYWRNLEYRILDKDGKPRPHLSYAYPAVRDFRLSIIREAAAYGVDGIHLNFLRHPPFFGFDPPLVEAFRQRYALDPREHRTDKRWHQLRAEVMTAFMRRVRAALDEVGRKTGKRPALSATMEYRSYLEQGLDVERWVKEGLVDLISPGVHGLGGTYFPIGEFAEMVKGTKCRLFPMLECTIRGHDPTPESERGEVVYESERMTLNRFKRRFLELHREGAEGVYPFNGGTPRLVRALSHLDRLEAWERLESPLIEWFAEVRLPDNGGTGTRDRTDQ